MTPEKQRIAIAEACGVASKKTCPSCFGDWRTHGCEECDQAGIVDAEVPDYLNDLNAMHEAEKLLREREWCWRIYAVQLHAIAGLENEVHATASQRAEAFLKTLNLWKD